MIPLRGYPNSESQRTPAKKPSRSAKEECRKLVYEAYGEEEVYEDFKSKSLSPASGGDE